MYKICAAAALGKAQLMLMLVIYAVGFLSPAPGSDLKCKTVGERKRLTRGFLMSKCTLKQ